MIVNKQHSRIYREFKLYDSVTFVISITITIASSKLHRKSSPIFEEPKMKGEPDIFNI
jgi:hypothetical protein